MKFSYKFTHNSMSTYIMEVISYTAYYLYYIFCFSANTPDIFIFDVVTDLDRIYQLILFTIKHFIQFFIMFKTSHIQLSIISWILYISPCGYIGDCFLAVQTEILLFIFYIFVWHL